MESLQSLKFFPFLESKPLISPVGLSGVVLFPQRNVEKNEAGCRPFVRFNDMGVT